MEWQPIETAPKDGTIILGWRFGPVAMKWTGHKTYPWEAIHLIELHAFLSNGFSHTDNNLTHWMPLPTPPVHQEDA